MTSTLGLVVFLSFTVIALTETIPYYDQSASCDACRSLTERFHSGWEEVVRKQAGDGRAEAKSSTPPTITYNQEIEDYLQGFCKSTRISTLRDYIQTGCARVMDTHKREVVAKYLSVNEIVGSSMKTTNVPRRTREVCTGLTKECKTVPPTYNASQPKLTKCQACQRTVMDAQYVLRRSKKYSDKLKSLDVFEHLESLCTDTYLRYDDDPDTVFKVCEELMEDHEDVMLNILAAKDKKAVQKICVDTTDWCNSSDLLEK